LGQKTHPIGFRLAVTRPWDARWYDDKNFAQKLEEDNLIRSYVKNRLKRAGLSKLTLDRTTKRIVLTIHTSRPGVVIGKSGKEIAQLEEELKNITAGKEVKILINEVKRPETDAQLIGDQIAQQLEGRISFRRAMKGAISAAMRAGAEGVRVKCGGRLGGAEIARTEQYKEGRIPLHTLRADIDFARSTAQTIYGTIGIKVWVCHGDIIGQTPLQIAAEVAVNGVEQKDKRPIVSAAGGEHRRRGGGRGRGGDGEGRGGGGGRGDDRGPRGDRGGDRGGDRSDSNNSGPVGAPKLRRARTPRPEGASAPQA
jgi:small subunit ribosomal protein S3